MNAAQNREASLGRKRDDDPAARNLFAGIEIEVGVFDVGVVNEIAVVVDDLDALADFERDGAGGEGTPFLSDALKWRLSGGQGHGTGSDPDQGKREASHGNSP